jgi:hypothetical protein
VTAERTHRHPSHARRRDSDAGPCGVFGSPPRATRNRTNSRRSRRPSDGHPQFAAAASRGGSQTRGGGFRFCRRPLRSEGCSGSRCEALQTSTASIRVCLCVSPSTSPLPEAGNTRQQAPRAGSIRAEPPCPTHLGRITARGLAKPHVWFAIPDSPRTPASGRRRAPSEPNRRFQRTQSDRRDGTLEPRRTRSCNMHTPMSVRSMGLTSLGHPRPGSGGPTEPLRHRRLRIAGSGPHAPRRTAGRRTGRGSREWSEGGARHRSGQADVDVTK